MNVAAFLSLLRRLDVHVWVDGESLRCSAPPGTLTEDLRQELRKLKEDILAFLRLSQAAGAQQSAIVPLQPHGSRPAIFAVPGAGDVFCFRALAQALGEDQPFFALQAPGLDGRSAPLRDVEALARHFAERICEFQPGAPRIVAGKCIGGIVAFELARELAARGERVLFLAFFGVPFPAFFDPLPLLRHRIEWHAQERARRAWRRARLLASQPGSERLAYLRWRLRQYRAAPDPLLLQHDEVVAATLAAVRAYEVRPLPVRLHYFAPSERWVRQRQVQAARWRPLVSHVESYCGPERCTEDDMLLGEHAGAFARQFNESCALALP